MADRGEAAFRAARAMVGARFRSQGKDPATGLDCVGLVWAAYAAAGRRLARPADYPLRGWDLAKVEAALASAGFIRADDAMRVGDVVLIAHPARQYHLGLIGPDAFIHAHAGLRRVVETPLDMGVRGAARWRLLLGDGDGDVGADGSGRDRGRPGRRRDRRGGRAAG